MENIEMTQKLMNWDLSLRYIVTLAIKGKAERPKDFKGNKKRGKILGMGPLNPKRIKQKVEPISNFGVDRNVNSGSGVPATSQQLEGGNDENNIIMHSNTIEFD